MRQGLNPDAIDRQLSHLTRHGVKAVYIHHARFPAERTLMMQQWASYLGELREQGRVVRFVPSKDSMTRADDQLLAKLLARVTEAPIVASSCSHVFARPFELSRFFQSGHPPSCWRMNFASQRRPFFLLVYRVARCRCRRAIVAFNSRSPLNRTFKQCNVIRLLITFSGMTEC